MQTPRKGLDEKDLHNPRRAQPTTVLFLLLLIVGGLVLATTLTLNFSTGHFPVFTFVMGIVLIAIALIGLIVKGKWL